jgi:hypothetical protein
MGLKVTERQKSHSVVSIATRDRQRPWKQKIPRDYILLVKSLMLLDGQVAIIFNGPGHLAGALASTFRK